MRHESGARLFAAAGFRLAGRKAEDPRFITRLIESGQFRAVIARRYPLEHVAEPHRYSEYNFHINLVGCQPKGIPLD